MDRALAFYTEVVGLGLAAARRRRMGGARRWPGASGAARDRPGGAARQRHRRVAGGRPRRDALGAGARGARSSTTTSARSRGSHGSRPSATPTTTPCRSSSTPVHAEYCPRCERPLPPKANFCPNCGAPVSLPEASERRLVTVVFVDMAGSTQLASQLDAERFREVLAAFHGMVAEEVAWLGGVAEGFIGDAVLAVFGIPAAHDDDALRAIRSAIDIRARAAELAGELGLRMPIEVRIGVHTGQVAVGTAHRSQHRDRRGGQPRRAAAAGRRARRGPGRRYHRAVDGLLRRLRRAASDRREGIRRRRSRAGRCRRCASRMVDRRQIAFVDRRREVALLRDVFERAAIATSRAPRHASWASPVSASRASSRSSSRGLPSETRVLIGTLEPVRRGR